jgi:hypothetical protein
MGIFDKLLGRAKGTGGDVAGKARDVAEEHAEGVKGGITKAADFVDEKTGGRAAGAIDKVEGAAGEMIDKVAGKPAEEPADTVTDTAPPAAPPAP